MCILCDNDVDVVDTWAAVCGSAWESNSWWYLYDYEDGDWDDPCTLWRTWCVRLRNPAIILKSCVTSDQVTSTPSTVTTLFSKQSLER